MISCEAVGNDRPAVDLNYSQTAVGCRAQRILMKPHHTRKEIFTIFLNQSTIRRDGFEVKRTENEPEWHDGKLGFNTVCVDKLLRPAQNAKMFCAANNNLL